MGAIAAAGFGIILGSIPGVGTNGNINSRGGYGLPAFAISGNPLSGGGGASYYAGGANGQGGVNTGNAGVSYGSGGGGSVSGAANGIGGNGAPGVIIVWEFS